MYFRYGNYSLTSSLTYGTGIQTPLEFLPIDSEVNLVEVDSDGSRIRLMIPLISTVSHISAENNTNLKFLTVTLTAYVPH